MSDSALAHLSWIASMLADDLFPTLPRQAIDWHEDSNPALALYYPRLRCITLRRSVETMPRSWQCQAIAHELCHAATANERVDHGPRWRGAMRRVGIEPERGLIAGGKLQRWLEMRGW